MRSSLSSSQPLTLERLREVLSYQPDTGLFTWLVRPARYIPVGSIAGSKTDKGYIRICVDGVMYRAHRLAWFYMNGEWPIAQIDHINGVRDDNSYCNIRPATPLENSRNTRLKAGSRSGRKGVQQKGNVFEAKICIDGRKTYLGCFKTLEDAANAYKIAATTHFKEFGRH